MCTTFSFSRNNDVILGRTMDLPKTHKYSFMYFPKNCHFDSDVLGNKLYTKYKIMGTTFEGYEHLLDGINETGLLGCTNSFRNVMSFPKIIKKEKLNITSTKLLNFFLTNCKSLEEIKKLSKEIFIVEKSSVDDKNFSRHYHYMFTDKYNKSLILEIDNGEIKVKENPYNIMTNSPKFETHIKNLHKYLEKKELKGNMITPTKRFLRAFDELNEINKIDEDISNLKLMLKILKKFTISEEMFEKELLKLPSITLYYSAITQKDKKYYLNYVNSNYINEFSFNDFKNFETKQILKLKK